MLPVFLPFSSYTKVFKHLAGWHWSISNSMFPTLCLWCLFWQVTSPSLESIWGIIQSIVSLCYNPQCISYDMCDYCRSVIIAKMLNYCKHELCLQKCCEIANCFKNANCNGMCKHAVCYQNHREIVK